METKTARRAFTTKFWPSEWQNGMIKTSNAMGMMTTELSPIAEEFIEYAADADMPVLDIGASYGVATYPALQNGAEVIACDLSESDLAILKKGVPFSYQSNLQTICKRFPNELSLKPKSLSAIHISMVLHFLTGSEVEEGLQKCYEWLSHAGKLFIVVMTPYHGIFPNAMTIYEERVQAGEKWPGAINLKTQAPAHWENQIPPFAHFFMPDMLQSAIERAGFIVEQNEFFCYKNFPSQYKTNGKEFIGLVARK